MQNVMIKATEILKHYFKYYENSPPYNLNEIIKVRQ